ncbi:MAG: (Fe-S)-binding protein [Gemmataceae bacterium]|nr:(Fe-S)-binding protein [Gemmataceae bacterium]
MTLTTARTSLDIAPLPPKSATGIDYELFLDCVHCGLCTSACPTYVELGTEMDSPRGRIYLMRAVTDARIDLNDDVRRHLDLCLDCRACESACPSGVQYGKLIEPFRLHMARTQPEKRELPWLQRLLLFHVTPSARRTRLALLPARFLQWTGLDRLIEQLGLLRHVPPFLRQLHEMLPRLQPHYGKLPEVLPAEGTRRARVALFTGCAGDAFFPRTNLNTARVLQKNGCEVVIPRAQVCCGALHYHSACEEPAQRYAASNCDVFKDVDTIIVNAAGCGAMLKDYGHLLSATPQAAGGEKFAGKVRDVSEFLMELGPVKPIHPLPLKAVYHDACHLCHAQQIRKQPRQLLEMIPELKLVPLNESEICCGAAGSYNLTQPEMAERLGERKARNILDADPQAVFTGNVGCLLQVARYLRPTHPDLWVAHPIDALWASYSGELPKLPSDKKRGAR